MIGLGSNRLSVCRRGGMSVTQAGRGGMEWLAGGRMPRWVNPYLPYSKAAGEALVAQFPTQWPTIRDYGFAHPEIVGYMNAYAPEDAKIAYSLVEGIGTRWLVGDSYAYINPNVSGLKLSLKVKCTFKFVRINRNIGAFGIYWQGTTNYRVYASSTRCLVIQYGGSLYQDLDGTTYMNKKYNMEVGNGKVKLNGTDVANIGTITTSMPLTFIIGVTNAGNSGSGIQELQWSASNTEIRISYFDMEQDGVHLREMIPFQRNGAMGMIDLLTGTFYGNANSSGSFSESIDSPS